MILDIIILIIGFIILIKGADLFVDGASNLAQNFKISKMVIGLTIVAFGTSSPEFAVSIKAMLTNSSEIVLGNVIGSNILNILLILGISAMIHNLYVKTNTIKKEIPFMLLISSILAIMMSDSLFNLTKNMLTRSDGLILVLIFCIFIYYLFTIIDKTKEESIPEYSIKKSIFYTVGGLIAIIIGSNFVVEGATGLAYTFGISEKIIGLTIIALGTSLPELFTSIAATKKGEYEIAIGNIVGSNIFNIGIVLGLPVFIFGEMSVGTFNAIDIIFLLLSVIVLYIFSKNKDISKIEGLILLVVFVIYYTLVFI